MRLFNTLAVLTLATLLGCGATVVNKPLTGVTGIGIKLKGPATFTLDDGEANHKAHPKTFEIPEADVRKNLKEGDIVKLIFRITDGTATQVESMWVKVKSKTDQGYIGTLDNDPYCTDTIKAGLEVPFQPKHVISIYE